MPTKQKDIYMSIRLGVIDTDPSTIKTREDALSWITRLINIGLDYHLDDDATDCLRDVATQEEAKKIQILVNHVVSLFDTNEPVFEHMFEAGGYNDEGVN